MNTQDNQFKINEDQYNEIIDKCNKRELVILIDTSSFRQLFCQIKRRRKIEETIDIPISSASILVRLIFYSLPLFGIAMSIFVILGFRFWAFLVLPLLLAICFYVHSKASYGRQNVDWPTVFLIIGIIAFFLIPGINIFLRLTFVLFPLQILLSKILYFSTARITFKLLFKYYKFFAVFYEMKYSDNSIVPMIYTETMENRLKFAEIKKKYNLG